MSRLRLLKGWWKLWRRYGNTILMPMLTGRITAFTPDGENLLCPVCYHPVKSITTHRKAGRSHLRPCAHELTLRATNRMLEAHYGPVQFDKF